MTTFPRRLALGIALALGLVAPASASAETFQVTTTADGANGACTPALCTLRDAVQAANASTDPVDEVLMGAGTHQLTLGQLRLTSSTPDAATAIAGAGARQTTVAGDGTDRIFLAEAGGTVTFRDMRITGGNADAGSTTVMGDGGGILNQSDEVVLRRVALTGNTALFSGGGYSAPLEGTGSTQVTVIEDSLIANNSISGGLLNGQGGGLALFGNATITNTTITGNTVSNAGINQGGGLVAATDPTAVTPATLTLLNTTIAGNTITGVGPGGPTPNVGGGIAGSSLGAVPALTDLRAKNTIVAGNTVDGGVQDCGLVNASQTSHNLSSDSSCGFTDAGSKQSVNANLGPLADNGGPTDTRSILGGTAAYNAGDNAGCPAADQRGIARPQVRVCDIGAYELQVADLSVRQKSRRKVRAGRKLTYTLLITNLGNAAAQNVRLSDRFPGKVLRLKGQKRGCPKVRKGKAKGKGKRPKLPLRCSFGTLEAGKTLKLKVRVRSNPKKKRKRLRNTATVTTTSFDSDRTNDSATRFVRVKRSKPKR